MEWHRIETKWREMTRRLQHTALPGAVTGIGTGAADSAAPSPPDPAPPPTAFDESSARSA